MTIAAEMRSRFAAVRLLSLDLDGVLTDGGLYYTDAGDELRKFNVKDGLGLKAVMAAGIDVCIITTSTAPAIAHRGRRLGIAHVFTGVDDKLGTLAGLARRLDVPLGRTAHVADDVNDLPVLRAVGLPLSVGDAMPAVKAAAAFVTAQPGGGGAVREICDIILACRQELPLPHPTSSA